MIFTQCYINELPYVQRLFESLKTQHYTGDFLAVLVDNPANLPEGYSPGFPLISFSEINPEMLSELSERYNWNELRNNCKPFTFSYLLQKNPAVVYVDPTTEFFASPAVLLDTLSENNAFLVPQLLFAHRHPKENDALNLGIYHNGTIGLNASEITDNWLSWWQHHTRFKGYFDPCKGMNTDRLCLEFAPIFFRDTLILRHPGVNVGLWNAAERPIQSANGRRTVENQPLISTNYANLPAKSVFRKIQPAYGIIVTELSGSQQTIARSLRGINQRIDAFFNRF